MFPARAFQVKHNQIKNNKRQEKYKKAVNRPYLLPFLGNIYIIFWQDYIFLL